MLTWVLAVACAGGATEAATPQTEARAPIATEAPALSFVLDAGDEEQASLGGQVDAASRDKVPTPGVRPLAFEYSEGYRVRRKLHKYASFATLPLFAAQFAVGQKLYDQREDASDGLSAAHGALVAGTGTLFVVNTATGVWNLSEGRKDPSHKKKRMVHGILMIVADAGFVATGLVTPEDEREGRLGGTNDRRRSTHRTLAFTSMGIATVSYLMMLFGH